MNTAVAPTPQLIVNIENVALLNKIKNAIKLMQGVGKISVAKPKKMSGIDEAMEDIRQGRVTEWASADEMFKALGV